MLDNVHTTNSLDDLRNKSDLFFFLFALKLNTLEACNRVLIYKQRLGKITTIHKT